METTKHLTARLAQISDATGFDQGDRLADADQVRDYFTVAAQQEMFSDDAITDQDELDDMAADVIKHHWHMLGEITQDGNTVTVHTGHYGASEIREFGYDIEEIESDDEDDFGPDGERFRVIDYADVTTMGAGGAVMNQNRLSGQEPIWFDERPTAAYLADEAIYDASRYVELLESDRRDENE